MMFFTIINARLMLAYYHYIQLQVATYVERIGWDTTLRQKKKELRQKAHNNKKASLCAKRCKNVYLYYMVLLGARSQVYFDRVLNLSTDYIEMRIK